MALLFALRGTALDARYSTAGGAHGKLVYDSTGDAPAVEANAGAGIFGGSVINLVGGAQQQKGLVFPGGANLGPVSTGGPITVRMRIVPSWDGSPASTQALFQFSGGLFDLFSNYCSAVLTSGKQLVIDWKNVNQDVLSSATTDPLPDFVSGVPVDIQISWDGSATAGSFKVSVDGALFQSFNPVRAAADGWARCPSLTIGTGINARKSSYYLNELCIYDTAESPNYGIRTNFDPANVYNPVAVVVPSVGDVRSGVSFNNGAGSVVGTLSIPVSVDPGESNVLSGVEYSINGDDKEGSLSPVTNTLTAMTVSSAAANAAANVITQGDELLLSLLAKDDDGQLHDLTGAVFETTIAGESGPLVFNNAAHEADADQAENTGAYTVRISGTAAMKAGKKVSFTTKVTQGPDVLHFHGTFAKVLEKLI